MNMTGYTSYDALLGDAIDGSEGEMQEALINLRADIEVPDASDATAIKVQAVEVQA